MLHQETCLVMAEADGVLYHHFGCVRGLKNLKRFWPYLMAITSCISTGKLEYCVITWFHVHEVEHHCLCRHIYFVRFETMI